MFGFFAPKAPLRTAEKAWVESRMKWLAENLGLPRLLQAKVILPTDEYFPGVIVGDDAGAFMVLDRLCEYMGVSRSRIDLMLCTEQELPDATGLYLAGDPATIKIQRWLLDDPESLVATLAHELAHEILLGGGLLEDNNEDLERLTDLLPAYLGVGAFAANNTIREATFRVGRFSWWQMHRHGYLPSRHFGYAMAVFAYVRDDQDVSWARILRPDVAEPFYRGLKYLRKTNDSLLTRQSAEVRSDDSDLSAVLQRLDSMSPTVRIDALWALNSTHAAHAAASVPRIIQSLNDRDRDVVIEALATLGDIGQGAVQAASRCMELLHHRCEEIRVSAALAIGQIGASPEKAVPELMRALDDGELPVVKAAAWALGEYGAPARRAIKSLLYGYERFLKRADDGIDVFAEAIARVSGDPVADVDAFFAAKGDRELHLFAVSELKAVLEGGANDKAEAADR